MTDEQIKKALKVCVKNETPFCCGECELGENNSSCDCVDRLLKLSLDLIARQQAEIKELEKEKYRLQKALNQAEDYRLIARTEAIKEFAERLKETPMRFSVEYVKYYDKPPIKKMVLFIDDNDINNLVKEMVGEQE
jgi:hypothetical protein